MTLPSRILPLRLERVCLDVEGGRLIHEISLELTAGPRTVVLGPNGAGKSLLLRLCHGLIEPTSGRITWSGPQRGDRRAVRSAQAMVFQRPVLLRRSAAGNIAHALAARGVPRHRRRALVDGALDQAGLAPLAERPARVLSGGEQQRLVLARAWALRPQLVFLDEPTSNLDPTATRYVEEMIQAIHAAGTKIVMTTHDLGQARRLADEVLFLHRGRLLERSSADRFFTRPDSEEGGAFLAGELLA